MKVAIFGIGGQDGSLLAHVLSNSVNEIYGLTSNKLKAKKNLSRLNLLNVVQLTEIDYLDESQIIKVLKSIKPDLIYFLAGQTSVSFSYLNPSLTEDLNIKPVVAICNYCEFVAEKNVKFLHAGSSEMFGNTSDVITETTEFKPVSPYGTSKAHAVEIVRNARARRGLNFCNAILFNHESVLRSSNFIFGKVRDFLKDPNEEKLCLGNLSVIRDWGWANEFVVGMHMILMNTKSDDYVIATGVSVSLEECLRELFLISEKNFDKLVEIDQKLYRPNEINANYANISKLKRDLNWQPLVTHKELMKILKRDHLL